ncbi:MAG: hypothetical protein QW723_04220 [Candidatus Bathyarchaeia archaeon]
MKKVNSIEEFIKEAKNLEEKMIRIQPYISSNEKFPCLRMEAKNIFYDRSIDKEFENPKDAEDFIQKLSLDLGNELSHLGFYVIVSDLKYLKKRAETLEEDDIKYLLHGFYE